MDNNEMINSLSQLLSGLNSLENLNKQWKTETENKNRAYKNYQTEEDRYNKALSGGGTIAKATGKAVNVLGIVLTVVFALFILLVKCVLSLGGVNTFNFVGFLVSALLIAGFYFLTTKLGGSVNKFTKKVTKTNEEYAPIAVENMQKAKDNYNMAEASLDQLQRKYADTYSYYKELIEWFPPAYCYPYAVDRVLFFFRNGRADSLKEALDKYEEEVYRDKMLAEQRRIATNTAISAAANLATAYNTGRIADNTADMAGSLRNIDVNTANIATNTARAAASAAAGAGFQKRAADTLDKIYDKVR